MHLQKTLRLAKCGVQNSWQRNNGLPRSSTISRQKNVAYVSVPKLGSTSPFVTYSCVGADRDRIAASTMRMSDRTTGGSPSRLPGNVTYPA